ncbi:MAG: heparan-alpha-glucosaminide N-acetyltransferase domain-containing protein, partial [Muribaculaceae bacterium]|nr:heparan-alpha-glucosaminide N-acetyltransferase domain-containing protein [Muribaculaceae bacterium]
MENKIKPQRLLALDIMRGITIAGMLLVNNPGSWGEIYAPLRHAEWHGLTPTDLVFPFFMFIMGMSTCFSLRKYDFRLSAASLFKVIRRTVVIFAIGLGIAWLAKVLYGIYSDRQIWDIMTDFSHIRVLGVMPRLAICYCAASVLAMLLSRKALAWTVGLLLALY